MKIMSTKLEINEKILNDSSDVQIHYLPAKIEGNGPTNVEKYFSQYIKKDNGIYENALRGYPLKGCNFVVPEGYKGVVFHEVQNHLDTEGVDRTLKAAAKFDRFTYWNYDKIPTNNDPFSQAMDILHVSDAIMKKISTEDIEAEIKEKKNKRNEN